MKIGDREVMFQLKQAVYSGKTDLSNVTQYFKDRNDRRMVEFVRSHAIITDILIQAIIKDPDISITDLEKEPTGGR